MPPHNKTSNVNGTSHDTLVEGAEGLSKQTTCADLGMLKAALALRNRIRRQNKGDQLRM